MNSQKTANDLVYLLYKCFLYYNNKFYKITQGAKERFEKRQWNLQRKAVGDRYILHEKVTDKILKSFAGHDFNQINMDFVLKILFQFKTKTKNYPNPEIPYSFCISVLRMMHPIELPFTLWEGSLKGLGKYPKDPNIKYIFGNDPISESWRNMLLDIELSIPAKTIEYTLPQIENLLTAAFPDLDNRKGISYYKELFFRNQHAYLIGYVEFNSRIAPFAMAFENDSLGIRADALLTDKDSIKKIFSFSRSYLQVNSSNTAAMVEYMTKILPSKHIGQLYINLGYHEYGREMLLLELTGKFQQPEFRWQLSAPQSKNGFLILSHEQLEYDVKIICTTDIDRWGIPLKDFVDVHKNAMLMDRAGRIPDSQYFEKIYLPMDSFDNETLDYLRKNSLSYPSLETGKLEINHLFLERKASNLFIQLENSPSSEYQAELLSDLGKCITELGMIGIFVEPISMEDFGVSTEGKVVFQRHYKIKNIQAYKFIATSDTAAPVSTEESVSPSEITIVPEAYLNGLFPNKKFKKEFLSQHKELLKPKFWNGLKKTSKSTTKIDLKPYQSNIPYPATRNQ
ncbi:MAG: bifunctional isocitrate dehydrogenase kinase/phosphatase [Cytophagales bacterium]|nr:bifunctional isocitrate dehydrogenase kinase/phosphatase [Cytophagales bacterium]